MTVSLQLRNHITVTNAAILDLKQRLSKLNKAERREMSAYLLKLKYESAAGKKATSRLMKAMDAGEKHRLSDLKTTLGR